MEGQLLFLRRTITKIKIAIVNKKADNRKDSIGNRRKNEINGEKVSGINNN